MSQYYRKWLNKPNVLSFVGFVLLILSVLMLPERTGQVTPIEIEVSVQKPDKSPLWVTVTLLPPELSRVEIVFPEGSGYSILVNRMPKNIKSVHSSSNPPHTVPTGTEGGNFWSFKEGPPANWQRRSVSFQLEEFVTPSPTGYAGVWRLRARDGDSGLEDISVLPALRASYQLTLSASIPNPVKLATGRKQFERQSVTPVEGFDSRYSEDAQVYYIYETVEGEFLAKWELLDAQRARDREFWLIFWSALLGLGIGFILEGFIVRI